jgi:hypothetical protein
MDHYQWLTWISNLSAKYHPNLVFEFISEVDKANLKENVKVNSP